MSKLSHIAPLVGLISLAASGPLAGSSAWAQTSSGQVMINGSVGVVLELRYYGSSLVGGAAQTSSQAQGDPLAYVMDLGNVADLTNPAAYVGGTVTLALRSTAPYTLNAVVLGSDLGSGANDFKESDIGFGVTNPQCQGFFPLNCWFVTLPGTTINSPYDNNPLLAPKVGRVPQFQATLADLSTSQALVSGPQISWLGWGWQTRSLTLDNHFAIGPQLWNPRFTPFNVTVVYTISSP